MPKFDMPKFDMPKFEVPAAFREMAEKGVAQAKDNYEKVKAVAEEATDLMEDTYATAVKGVTDYNLKVLEAGARQCQRGLRFRERALGREVALRDGRAHQRAHARKQFEAVTAQSKELAALAQKVATDTAEPIKTGVTKAFQKAA